MTTPAATTAERQRCERLAPLVHDALALLEHAAANGRTIDSAVRNPLIATADTVARGAPSLADEQAFFAAYEALTVATAPVTAETLAASRTVLPRLGQLFTRDGFVDGLQGLTLGRFVNALSFIVVLVGCCLALAYYTLGATTFERYQRLQEQAAQAGGTQAAGAELPDRLWRWAMLPCDQPLLAWMMCTGVDRARPGQPPTVEMQLEAARTTVARMNDVVLPLLLGWLGAHAWVLRQLTSAIAARTLAKGSMLSTLVRLSLGALAGFASSWLLTPEMVAGVQLKNVPAWALAFVAGYGIELVFAFMDRIIAAFTHRPASS